MPYSQWDFNRIQKTELVTVSDAIGDRHEFSGSLIVRINDGMGGEREVILKQTTNPNEYIILPYKEKNYTPPPINHLKISLEVLDVDE